MVNPNKNRIPRGIRNNNPLNIRVGNSWKGEVSHSTDKSFEQFQTMEYGIRAGFIILRKYIKKYGRNTIRKIISAWAPSNENNTESYILMVTRLSRIPAEQTIRFEDKDKMVGIVSAMIRVECGRSVDKDIISKAYEMV